MSNPYRDKTQPRTEHWFITGSEDDVNKLLPEYTADGWELADWRVSGDCEFVTITVRMVRLADE